LQNLVRQAGRGGNLANAAEEINRALAAAQSGEGRFNRDPAALENIAKQILDPLREAELELAKHLEILVEKDKIRAALEDELPAAYQNESKAYFEIVGKGKK
jgi:hypothetical protein